LEYGPGSPDSYSATSATGLGIFLKNCERRKPQLLEPDRREDTRNTCANYHYLEAGGRLERLII
jgi:hypothetical protein